MTSTPHTSSVDPEPRVTVGTDGLLTGLPVLLGFRPRDSLVVVAMGGDTGRRVGLTLRVDLPPPGEHALRESVCAGAAAAIARERPASAAVVVVGGGPAPAWTAAEAPPPRADVARAAVLALAEAGVVAHTVVWAAEIAPGAAWCCYPLQGCGCRGRLSDPSSTELAAAAAVEGRVVYESREELERMVAPTDTAESPAEPPAEPPAEGPPSAARPRRGSPGREALGKDGSDGGVRGAPRWPADRVHTLHAALAAAGENRLVVDAQLVRIMTSALRHTRFRDLALSTCTGPEAHSAEQLWAALARTCRGPAAADPAVLLAVCALVRGDGALATIALQRAAEVRPNHRLARDLRTAMAAGWGPTEFRAWLAGEL